MKIFATRVWGLGFERIPIVTSGQRSIPFDCSSLLSAGENAAALGGTLYIRSAWRKWLADFADAADRLQLTRISLAFSEQAQHKSVVLALYARLRSELATALVVADAKRDLAFRNTCRPIIECALHLEMAETDPTYLTRLKEDDDASRRSSAIRFLSKNPTLAKEADKTLSGFIQSLPKQKSKLQVSELDTALPRLTHSYRELSVEASTGCVWSRNLRNSMLTTWRIQHR